MEGPKPRRIWTQGLVSTPVAPCRVTGFLRLLQEVTRCLRDAFKLLPSLLALRDRPFATVDHRGPPICPLTLSASPLQTVHGEIEVADPRWRRIVPGLGGAPTRSGRLSESPHPQPDWQSLVRHRFSRGSSRSLRPPRQFPCHLRPCPTS